MSAVQQPTSPNHETLPRQRKGTIGSWFSKKFGRRNSVLAASSSASPDHTQSASKRNKESHSRLTASAPLQAESSPASPSLGVPSFAPNSAQGLANTLTVPGSSTAPGTPPPQLASLPPQEPLGNIDFARSPSPLHQTHTHTLAPSQDPVAAPVLPATASSATSTTAAAAVNESQQPTQSLSTSDPNVIGLAHQNARSSSDSASSSRDGLGRDSIGNRTMDTGKSRASTKPTTLMSLETRDPTVLPTTHIAQLPSINPNSSSSSREGAASTSAVQFASPPQGRASQGVPNQQTITDDSSPFINVPSHSRPHPANNPQPSALPPDNASVLTLASSTAAHSLGGAASSRGHGHSHAPSLGGARSIGGSLMGDRRNSSDTYASLKALPPLSRRGSDSSSRTRDSIAASATGQNSAQAMFIPALAGPGAPSDRVSIHRTPSQRTVATQLSIPLSTSASNPALQAYSNPKPDSTTGHSDAPPAVTAAAAADSHIDPSPVPAPVPVDIDTSATEKPQPVPPASVQP